MATPTFHNEHEFTRAVMDLAEECQWETFRIRDRAYQTGGVPAGFPDLILRYRDIRGNFTLVAAELKTDNEETSQPNPAQLKFLEELAAHMPTFIFRYRDWDYIEAMLRNGPPQTTGEIIRPSLPINRDNVLLPPQLLDTDAVVQRLAEEFANPNFPRGDLAELRRMNTDDPAALSFWRLMAKYDRPDTAVSVPQWSLIMQGIALMTPIANANTPVGRALFLVGSYSENRLNRLLVSRGPMFRDLLGRLFRILASAKQPLDWGEMANLILDDNDNARLKIASEYYRAAR
jgi:CRISPR type I-E-associated protein CasB/Cse2